MISYVECLGGEGAGPSVASRCWNTGPDEERDELLPCKMASLQPKTEGSLRRRLLSAKVYQHHNAWLKASGAAGIPGSPTGDKKPLPPHLQYPGPWYRSQHLPPHSHIYPSFAPEAPGKLFVTLDAHGKSHLPSPTLQKQSTTCPVLTLQHRTNSFPPIPEHHPGYPLPVPSPLGDQPSFREQEVPTQYHYQPSRRRRSVFFCLRRRQGRRSGLEATQATPLLNKAGDGDSKWSVCYTTQKPQQGLIFVPGKRRSGSADDLQACNRLTQHEPACSHLHYQSPNSVPSSSGLNQSDGSTCSGWKNKSRKMSSTSSGEDERFILNNKRPLTPLVLNPVHLSSSLDVFAPAYEPEVDVEREPIPCLPTPEERMRQQAKTVGADIVPINVTGESFDRQASFRRTLSSSDSLSRRPRSLSRRKTVTGAPDIGRKLDLPLVLPGQFSTVGQGASSCTPTHQQKTTGKELEERERAEISKEEKSSARRIQAPRGEVISGLMASLTSSSHVELCQEHSSSCCSSDVQRLPRLATNSSLNSNSSCNSTSYRTLSASSSCCQSQDLQGFPSDLIPLLPFDPKARVTPQSPFSSSSSLSSSPVTSSSLPSTPSHALHSEWSYPSDKPLNEAAQRHSSTSSSHSLFSPSIADSESQFSYQALEDHNTQFPYDGGSCSEERRSQPLSPSSSLHSSLTGSDWNSITQEMRCVSGEGWSCDPLLSSGCSSPAFTDSNSLCSEKITFSLLPIREKNKSGISNSHTIIRSISLRKSKRPPPPPLRSDSLRRRPGRSKPFHSSSIPRLECTAQQTPNLSPQTFHDPWVPRKYIKQHQRELNCGTVTTFEPLSPNCHAETFIDAPASEPRSQSQSHSHACVSTSSVPGSEEEAMQFTLNPQPAASSVAELQRLASPSSGYSSQSNTPTPGTPVSSPLSSPLTASPGAFSLQLISPFSSSPSSSIPQSLAISSLPRTRSRVEGRPRPPVPERKSSLFSSLSSSFSSTSSLSSCTLSEHPVFPASPLPPPPPLPQCSSSLSSPSFFYSPICGRLPPAPPLPDSCVSAPPSFSKLSAAPPSPPSSLPPPPPPPPPLPPSFLPSPSPLPPFSRPPPPPYLYAIRHALESTVSQPAVFPPPPSPPPSSEILELPLTNLPPLAPPPPLPSLRTSPVSPLTSQSLIQCLNPYLSFATCRFPLVTAQALQDVKLRSIKNQEALLTDAILNSQVSMSSTNAQHADTNYAFTSKAVQPDCSPSANANVDGVVNTDVEVLRPVMVSSPAHQRTLEYQAINDKAPQIIQSNDQARKESDTCVSLKNYVSSPDSPLTKMSFGNDQSHTKTIIHQQKVTDTFLTETILNEPGEKHRNTENDSSYWTHTGRNQVSACGKVLLESKDKVETNGRNNTEMQNHSGPDKSPMAYSKVTQSNRVFKSASPIKPWSPEKPTPPKKPDLCILGLVTCPEVNASPGSSPHKQKLLSLYTKPDLSSSSPRKIKPLFASENTREAPNSTSVPCDKLEITGMSHNQSATGAGSTGNMSITGSRNKLNGIISTLENCVTSGTWQTNENSGDLGDSSAQTGGTQATLPRRLYKDSQKTFHKRVMRSSLAEDEDEDEKVEERGTLTTMMMMMSSSTKKRDKPRRRKRRTGRQVLLMSTIQPTPSSSSSSSSSSSLSSSSSGDERDVAKRRTVPTSKRVRMPGEQCNEETSDSESSCAQIGQSRYSLSSALSTESLRGELSLPDLLIQEPGEEEEQKRSKGEAQKTEVKTKESREFRDADLFVSVSADQMFASGQPRSTEDLFAVIHRSKRKMLGRWDSEEDGHHIMSSSCYSRPVTPADPDSFSTRPVAFKTKRSSRSESFKALLLRKGSQSDSYSRISAVERLCKVVSPTIDLQNVPSLTPPSEQTQVKPKSLFHTLERQDISAHLTLDVPVSPTTLCSQNISMMLGLRQSDLMSAQLFFLYSMRPRSLTPPCSASRRFAARHRRLIAAPMTAIFEGECEDEEEEEDNNEVSIESLGIEEESSQKLVGNF